MSGVSDAYQPSLVTLMLLAEAQKSADEKSLTGEDWYKYVFEMLDSALLEHIVPHLTEDKNLGELDRVRSRKEAVARAKELLHNAELRKDLENSEDSD